MSNKLIEKRLRYKPKFLRDRISEFILLSKTIVQFKKEKSSLLEGEYYDGLLSSIIEYEEGFFGIIKTGDVEKLYRVYYDLIIGTFNEYKKEIVECIDLENTLDLNWILGNKSTKNEYGVSTHIKWSIGSNYNPPKKIGIELKLSEIFGCAHLISLKYKNNELYQKESRMADFYIWTLYRIFSGFDWGNSQINENILVAEKHIKNNILGIEDENTNKTFRDNVTGVIKQLPGIAKLLTSTFATNQQSAFSKNVEKASDTAQKFIDNPETTELLFEVLDELRGVTDGKELNITKVVGNLLSKTKDTQFTDRLKKTVEISTGMTVQELIEDHLDPGDQNKEKIGEK